MKNLMAFISRLTGYVGRVELENIFYCSFIAIGCNNDRIMTQCNGIYPADDAELCCLLCLVTHTRFVAYYLSSMRTRT